MEEVRLVTDFAVTAAVVIVMRRAAQELKLLPKKTIGRCASCGREPSSRCRCRHG